MTYQHQAERDLPAEAQSNREQYDCSERRILAARAEEILDDIRWELGRDLESASAAAARLVALLAPKPTEPALVPGGLATWQKRKVEKLMRDRLNEKVPIKDMATAVSLSVSYFSRAFKISFGEAPHAYIVRLRVQLARQLMLASKEPLSQIAQTCGFADQAHLSRIFRGCVGQSPNAWRRSQITDACPKFTSLPHG